jgi:hypothetical protein
MDRQVAISVEQFISQMHGEFEEAMRQVAHAVNHAPNGQWINASELPVRDIMNEFKRKVHQTALQMRLDAAEGDFSPGGPKDLQENAEQGAG